MGKTVYVKTLIKKLLEKGVNKRGILYVSCDRLTSRFELLRILEEFYLMCSTSKPLYIFLDEITYLNDWQLALKNIADASWIDDLVIVATGSSPILLKKGTERLPGRKIEENEYYIRPFTFREFILNFPENKFPRKRALEELKKVVKRIKIDPSKPITTQINEIIPFIEELITLFNTYIITGGFPEAILQYLHSGRVSEKTVELFIRLILSEITKLDKSEYIALRILRYILDNMTQRVTIHKIAQECNLHHATVREYLELLQESFLIYILEPWDLSKKKLIPKRQKKLIISDPFIHHALFVYLNGSTWEDALDAIEQRIPQLVECTVISHLAQMMEIPYVKEWWSYLGYYYNKTEIDAVVKFGDKLVGFEVKYEEKVKKYRYPIPVQILSKYDLSLNPHDDFFAHFCLGNS